MIVLVLGIFLVLFDIYFLKSWSKFIRQHEIKPVFSHIFNITGIIMFMAALYVFYLNAAYIIPGSFGRTVNIIASIWYLPKLVITPYLMIRDFIAWLVNKFNEEKKKDFEKKRDIKLESSQMTESRRKFVHAAGWSLASVPFVVVTDGLMRTTYNYQIHSVEVPIVNLPSALDGLKIVQITDVHAGTYFSDEPIQEVRWLINNMRPDFVFVTGDFVNYNSEEYLLISKEMSKIKANIAVMGCLGNHDHYMPYDQHNRLKTYIEDSGIQLLNNSSKILEINGEILQVAGIDNINMRHKFGDYDKALKGLSNSYPTILLCHDPTNWDKSVKGKLPVDLMLSGHTHGGQVGIEMMGADLSPARLMYKQWAGLYNEGDQYLYVSRGIGTVGIPLRVGVPPEITSITLRTFVNVT